ncbi:MAG TPA: hypothetical protein VE075_01985 [Thermoanaerobaculia bacterium]|nr:hypothetical protein [Thermoanaerobaculia bacterium]
MSVLALAAGLVIAVRGLPLMLEALAGRRIEAAVRAGDCGQLRRAAAGASAAGLAEVGRVLRRLPTAELLALGDGMAAAAGEDERGAWLLAAIAEAVERRDEALARWTRVQQRRRARGGAVPGAGTAAVAAAKAGAVAGGRP